VAVLIASIALMTPIRAQEPAPRGPSEGIKVHGDWVIEVHNPDGALVSRQAFRNALLIGNGGDWALVQALGRKAQLGGWTVLLRATASPSLTCLVGDGKCRLREGTDFSVSAQKTVPAALVLSGQATLLTAGSLGWVGTGLTFISADGQEDEVGFSGHALATSIPTTAGQIIQFTVTFTFS